MEHKDKFSTGLPSPQQSLRSFAFFAIFRGEFIIILSAFMVLAAAVVMISGCEDQPESVPVTSSAWSAAPAEKPQPAKLDTIATDDSADDVEIAADIGADANSENLTEPIDLESMGQGAVRDVDMDRLAKPMEDVIAEEKQLKASKRVKFTLAPIPETIADASTDAEAGEDGSQMDSATPYDSPLDAPAPELSPESGAELVERDNERNRLDIAGKKSGQQVMKDLDAGRVKNLPRKGIVYNKPQLIAGATLQVNNRYITVDQVLAALHSQLSRIPREITVQEFASHARQLIAGETGYQVRQLLVYTEAQKYLDEGIKARVNEELSAMLREMIAESGGSKESLRRKCLSEGMTLEEVIDAHRRGLTVSMYMQSKFYPAISVTRRMLWNYYRKHQSNYVTDRKLQMQIIAAPFAEFLPKGVTQPTAAERQLARKSARVCITGALEELKSGKDFTDVTRMYSRGIRAAGGGVWPMMTKGSSAYTTVENVAFKLPYSRYSGIIEEPKVGFFIVKAMRVDPGKTISFEQAQDKITTDLKYDQFMKLRGEYMQKILEKATIGATEPFVKFAVDQAIQRYWRGDTL